MLKWCRDDNHIETVREKCSRGKASNIHRRHNNDESSLDLNINEHNMSAAVEMEMLTSV